MREVTSVERSAEDVVYLQSILNDITERKQMEETLRHTLERSERDQRLLRTVIDSSPDWIFVKDTESRFLLVNESWARSMSMRVEDALGKSHEEIGFSHEQIYGNPEKGIRGFRIDDLAALSGEIVRNPYNPVTYADGTLHIFETQKSPLRDAEGNIIGMLGISHDITRRLEREQAIESLQRQNQLILDAVGEGIYGVNAEGRMMFINPAAAKMLGWDAIEVIGKFSHELLHHTKPDGSHYPVEECPSHRTLITGQSQSSVNDEVFWRKDGTSFAVEYTTTPIFEQDELIGGVVVFRDITERKIAEAELNLLYQQTNTRALQEQFVNQISVQLQQRSDVNSLLNAAVQELGTLLGARVGRVRLSLPEWGGDGEPDGSSSNGSNGHLEG